jgi:hypothetical protein
MPIQGGIDYEREAQLEAWVERAIADGTARQAIRVYIASWRQQEKPRLSNEPFRAMAAVVHAAYPGRSERDNGHVALRLLHWTQRDHGEWLTRALDGGR